MRPNPFSENNLKSGPSKKKYGFKNRFRGLLAISRVIQRG